MSEPKEDSNRIKTKDDVEFGIQLNDPRKMPCFRSAMVYGLSGGVAATLLAAFINSKPDKSIFVFHSTKFIEKWRHADRWGMGFFGLFAIGRW